MLDAPAGSRRPFAPRSPRWPKHPRPPRVRFGARPSSAFLAAVLSWLMSRWRARSRWSNLLPAISWSRVR